MSNSTWHKFHFITLISHLLDSSHSTSAGVEERVGFLQYHLLRFPFAPAENFDNSKIRVATNISELILGRRKKKKREAQVYVASQAKVKALSWSAVTWGKQFQVILFGIYYSAFSSHCSVRNLALGCNNTCSLTAAHQNVLPSLKAEGEGRGSEILSIL